MRHRELLVLLSAGLLLSVGCANKKLVRSTPPSVSEPPVEEKPPVPEPPPPPEVETKVEPLPASPTPLPEPEPPKRPTPRPRPAPVETAEAPKTPKPEAPQISPQLSDRDLGIAQRNTNSNISTAEKNLRAANGKRLNTAQNDLVEKIKGFLLQSREAILADDWVRAQNLADKARVLSVELTRSL